MSKTNAKTVSDQLTVHPRNKLSDAARAAIIAAVAQGKTQAQVAKEFGVHRNTVWSIMEAVRTFEHPSNPMSKAGHERITEASELAVLRAVECPDDVYRAGDAALKWLSGKGVIGNASRNQVDLDVAINISWGAAQEPEHASQVIDVSPLDSHKET